MPDRFEILANKDPGFLGNLFADMSYHTVTLKDNDTGAVVVVDAPTTEEAYRQAVKEVTSNPSAQKKR